ncbi:MAG: peptidoglycan D,D-transpeptidase FtsI family protein, partial [Planctomycetota bacterium]
MEKVLEAGREELRASRAIAVLLGGALLYSGARIVSVHTREAPLFARSATLGLGSERIPAPRGDILDRNGRLLAHSVPVYDLHVDCWARGDMPEALPARILEIVEEEIPLDRKERERVRGMFRLPAKGYRRKWLSRPGQDEPRQLGWRWSRRLVEGLCSRAVLRRLEALGQESFDGCRFLLRLEPSWRRCYSLGRAACHVVGMIAELPSGEEHSSGLEALPVLRRHGGSSRSFRRLAGGRRIAERRAIPEYPRQGRRPWVRTTLDADTQELAHELIRERRHATEADWGLLLLFDLESGEILALAAAPDFDPAHREKGDSFFALTHHSLFVPGSVIKPLLIALALERGVVQPGQQILCGDDYGGTCWRIGRRIVHDDHHIGRVPLERVLICSSNIGAARIGAMGGPELHREMLRLFRLGEAPLLGLPLARRKVKGESRTERVLGELPPAWRFEDPRNYLSWTGPSLSYGYELLVYPLTFARAMAMVVTGRDFELRLLQELRDRDADPVKLPRAGPGRRLFSQRTVTWMRRTLAQVVCDPEGTARHISGEGVDNVIAGKTGTSVLRLKGPEERVNTCCFVGFTPVHAPRYLAMAVLQKKRVRRFYGGKFAAPAVRD